MDRRRFLTTSTAGAIGAIAGPGVATAAETPNIVLILADDLGYGDLGCYGSHTRTPNLNRMAREGVLFRQFCSASPVCSPSRAGLLTGRYGVRSGIHTVLMPTDTYGLPDTEVTIAQMLKPAGYKTMLVGKWHLGSQPRFLPTNHGFDEFYGLPYSADQDPSVLMHNTDVIESPVQLSTITQRFTEQAVNFIRRSKNSPFFLYMPQTSPHLPLAVSPAFRGKSALGLYGDVVEELDWSVGQVLDELTLSSLDRNTLVIFSSDNGPWFQGSPGRLRGRKGDTFEGGMREPFIARFTGRIPANKIVRGFASTLDMLPTIASLTNSGLPPNPLDGVDIWPVLTGEAESVERPLFLYFDDWHLQCARSGRWKLHLARYNSAAFTAEPREGRFNLRLINPELYDLDADSAESADNSADNPGIVADLRSRVESLLPTLPANVQTAWNQTQKRAVHANIPGGWPVPIL